MVIKGQFVPFDARLDAVNKHRQLETIEKNLAEKEKTPLETRGKPPDPSVCPHSFSHSTHNQQRLSHSHRRSLSLIQWHRAQRWMRVVGDAKLCASVGGSSTKAPTGGPPAPSGSRRRHRTPISSSTGPDLMTAVGGFFRGNLCPCRVPSHL